MFGHRYNRLKQELPTPEEALPGRSTPMPVAERHYVLGTAMQTIPDGHECAVFGLGCFWGAERKFWQLPNIYCTAVGYSAGFTPNPTYDEVCTGRTGHNEVVRVVYDPEKVAYTALLKVFWECHDPTQGMRQGNDVGTQYRSGIYWQSEQQRALAEAAREAYQAELQRQGLGTITTEIIAAQPFYFAEDYHQQYLAKVPHGYCGLGGTGVSFPAT